MNKEKLAAFFGVSRATAFNMINDKRHAALFVDKYLTESDIDEFIASGKISRFETIPSLRFDPDIKEFINLVKTLRVSKMNLLFYSFIEYIEKNKTTPKKMNLNNFLLYFSRRIEEFSKITKDMKRKMTDDELFGEAVTIMFLYPATFLKIQKFIKNDFREIYEIGKDNIAVQFFVGEYIIGTNPKLTIKKDFSSEENREELIKIIEKYYKAQDEQNS
jgi:hypothetical protein